MSDMYEYDLRSFDSVYMSDIVEHFNKLSKDGWEIVQWTQSEPIPGFSMSIWITVRRKTI